MKSELDDNSIKKSEQLSNISNKNVRFVQYSYVK